MFKENEKVTVIGSFIVKDIKDEYVELDPFEKGHIESTEKYLSDGYIEVGADGKEKEFDGFQVGDFFKLNGEFSVVRSNEVFSKLQVGKDLVSVPNHKIIGVD